MPPSIHSTFFPDIFAENSALQLLHGNATKSISSDDVELCLVKIFSKCAHCLSFMTDFCKIAVNKTCMSYELSIHLPPQMPRDVNSYRKCCNYSVKRNLEIHDCHIKILSRNELELESRLKLNLRGKYTYNSNIYDTYTCANVSIFI